MARAWLGTRAANGALRAGLAFAAGALVTNAAVLTYFALAGGLPALVEQFNVFRELFPLGPPRTLPGDRPVALALHRQRR
jgi:hypothetical protein